MKNLLWLLVLVAVGCAQHADKKPQTQLTAITQSSGGEMPEGQKNLHFSKAELHWQVFPEQQRIAGHAILTFKAKAALTRLSLDLDPQLVISQVMFNQAQLPNTQWQNPEGRLFIQLPETVALDHAFTITVDYAGNPHVAKKAPWDGGFVWSKTADGQPWIATAVEGEGCDLFWPCIDQPTGEPDTAELYITVPAPLVAPSNGVFKGMTENDGWRTYHWQVAQPNTYAIALNIAPYEKLEATYHSRFGNSYPMNFWYLKGEEQQAKALFAEFPTQLDFFEQMIGPYPFANEKMGVVHTPYLGMEHQTINAYGNGYAKSIFGYDGLLQHELAHEWFGNQLTNSNWDDYWLHEGFGTYMQPLYAQYLWGNMAYAAELYQIRAKITNKAAVVSGQSQTEESVYDPERGPGQDIYNKGALVLHTLRHYLGDDKFFQAVRELVYGTATPQPGNFKPRYSSTQEFIEIVNRISGQDMHWFFDNYLYQAQLPKLAVNRNGELLQLRWLQTKSVFPMPVEVMVDGELHTVDMPAGQGSLNVGAAARVQVDPQQYILKDRPHFAIYQAWEKARKAQVVTEKKPTKERD
ncbi:M1 family metallopeptidase [Shewanella fodinae]|uniref:M1 family metallopeptidase n=1 Tax=Shewanella fodinae TaxID=552357 RepID=UPI0016735330|nr:M1 family metallopeptidase [Shewanella fodinae]MCL2908163.1 M1 family metallopeptidase [Shewanella fodinae]GGZ13804.1 peptidase M1 [Shewanella fodinae]